MSITGNYVEGLEGEVFDLKAENEQLKQDRAELIKTIKSHGYLFQDLMDNMANTDEVKVAYENIKNDLKKLGEI